MQITMRWFGLTDPVPLWKLRQVPNLTGIVSVLHGLMLGVPWPPEAVAALREQVTAAGLKLSVIGSTLVREDIKLGNARRSERIDAFIASPEAVAAAGVPVICYNFMPVFGWTRTALAARPDRGWMIWGETRRPGYGLCDRALGATYPQSLIDAAALEGSDV